MVRTDPPPSLSFSLMKTEFFRVCEIGFIVVQSEIFNFVKIFYIGYQSQALFKSERIILFLFYSLYWYYQIIIYT